MNHGYDDPRLATRTWLETFSPVIVRDLRHRDACFVQIAYAHPRLGTTGIISAVWQAMDGTWCSARFLCEEGSVPPLTGVPAWLAREMAELVLEVGRA